MQSLHNNYGLGKGETSAIVLAKELKADFIFIDDRPARKFAINFFHNELTIVSGTIGILRFATLKGLITKNQFKSKIDFLKENGFYLKDNVYQHILQEINELP
ncbi:DUF3368 domain-containing protein [Candidatus Desantisbacteria bacterium]|nr:DUF3368 domain-containing protein [Candidatus Desantisbacteria bacterium]